MLIWLDIETTGIEPEDGVILEVASIITTDDLEVVATYDEVIHYDHIDMDTVDPYVRDMHTENGLWDRVRASLTSPEVIEHRLLGFWEEHVERRRSPLCGSSVHFDRSWITHHWPQAAAHLHYRNIDVSTLKELVRRWDGEEQVYTGDGNRSHRALDDIQFSIAELRAYRSRLWGVS